MKRVPALRQPIFSGFPSFRHEMALSSGYANRQSLLRDVLALSSLAPTGAATLTREYDKSRT